MPSSLSKKPGKKRSSRKSDLTAVPVEESALCTLVGVNCKPEEGKRSGLTMSSLIMLLVTAGCVTIAVLAYQKMNLSSSYAAMAQSRFVSSELRANELAERVNNLETLNELQSKVNEMIWKEYTSPNLALSYPEACTIVKATAEFPALVVNCYESKIDIFRAKDFPGGTRVLPDGVVATKVGSTDNPEIVPYDVWAYRMTENASDKIVFDKIVASIKVIK